jgi:hypothetical protein
MTCIFSLSYRKSATPKKGSPRQTAAPFPSSLDHRLHFLLKQILPITNFQIRSAIAASFLRRGIKLFSFQKSPAGGELDNSHVTPKSNLNILRYGVELRKSVPPSESDPGRFQVLWLSGETSISLPNLMLQPSYCKKKICKHKLQSRNRFAASSLLKLREIR